MFWDPAGWAGLAVAAVEGRYCNQIGTSVDRKGEGGEGEGEGAVFSSPRVGRWFVRPGAEKLTPPIQTRARRFSGTGCEWRRRAAAKKKKKKGLARLPILPPVLISACFVFRREGKTPSSRALPPR